ncbi:MAG: DUF637 domain-containing protein, partial [Betaproteobacteria bacterium]|nr:DUF637 domain-containing protein [Desulfobulbus sp.]MCL2877056.1 DUF637 domain-containing protein [Betaproteobacteria bacterium]
GSDFKDGLINSIVGDFAALTANQIGTNWGNGQNPALQTLAHGALGAAAAKLTGKDAAAGALGGLSEGLFDNLVGDNFQNGSVWYAASSMLIGGAIAEAFGRDGITAAQAAQNAALNNRQLHPKERKLIQDLALEKAQQACGNDAQCVRDQTLYWTDALERVAESWVDDKEFATNSQYLAKLEQINANSGTEGHVTGAVDRYFANLQTAAEMLAPYQGKAISGTNQTYFSATPEQRADYTLNYILGFPPAPSIIPGMANRDQDRLESMAVMNGSAQPVYLLEELVLGGMLTNRVLSLLGRTIGSIEVATAAKGGMGLSAEAQSLLQAAESPFKGQTLTNAGRATTKHPEYFGFGSTEELRAVYRTDAQLNTLANTNVQEILSNGVRTTGTGGRYPNGWVTYTLPDGRAASWTASGEFIGFRGLQK